MVFYIGVWHWRIQGGAAPQQDPILSFSHVFSRKAYVSEVGAPPTGWHPPNGKSWIRHCMDTAVNIIPYFGIALNLVTNYGSGKSN